MKFRLEVEIAFDPDSSDTRHQPKGHTRSFLVEEVRMEIEDLLASFWVGNTCYEVKKVITVDP